MNEFDKDPFAQSQAQEANHSGQFLEQAIMNDFKRRGVLVEDDKHTHGMRHLFQDKYLLKNVPYMSIYGCKSKSEFVYVNQRTELKVRIECRWQQEGGSVDEKFVYFFENAKRVPEPYVWLIIDGNGARAKALFWIKREALAHQAKKIRIYSLVEARQAIKPLVERDRG